MCCEKPEKVNEISNEQDIKTRTNSKGTPQSFNYEKQSLTDGNNMKNSVLSEGSKNSKKSKKDHYSFIASPKQSKTSSKGSSNDSKFLNSFLSKNEKLDDSQNNSKLEREFNNKPSEENLSQIKFVDENMFFSHNSSSFKEEDYTDKKLFQKSQNRQNKSYFFSCDNDNSSLGRDLQKFQVEFDYDNIILDEEIEVASKLVLREKNFNGLFGGRTLEINAAGEVSSERNSRDGITFFGPSLKYNDKIVNDVIVNISSSTNLRRIFAIYYDRKKTNYVIQNLNNDYVNNKFFMYAKIFHEFSLSYSKSHYFLLGQILVIITINDKSSELNIRMYLDKKKKEFSEYSFTKADSPVSIGRDECSINIENKYLSRKHCTLWFDELKDTWNISDGNGKGKHSSHGTWLIINDKFVLNSLEDSYEIKIGSLSFVIEIEQ